jgi:hypothetical protein
MSIAEPGSERVGKTDSKRDDSNQQKPTDLADDTSTKKSGLCLCGCFGTFCESECYWPNC